MKEYDRFEKGAANSNTSTAILKKQLENDECRIIITTIQKLSTFIKKNPAHAVYQKHVVIIFDECHRSQFGDMHTAIVKSFKKYHLFGFTGTPIFAANAGASRKPQFFTTEQTFGDQLHTYTIVDAINDKNVLPLWILSILSLIGGVLLGIEEEEIVWAASGLVSFALLGGFAVVITILKEMSNQLYSVKDVLAKIAEEQSHIA